MASPIARRPAGLLDLLLSQQQGTNPSNLSDNVNPTIDMAQFYYQDRLSVKTQNDNETAVGGTVTITVPAGESWLLWASSFAVQFATVNQRIYCYGHLTGLKGSTSPCYFTDYGGMKTPTGATDIVVGAYWFPNGFIVPSGTNIVAVVGSINLDAQPNIQVNHRVLYARMES